MKTRDFQIINKILQEILVIENLLTGFDLERFSEDERTKRAACMTLINIGELTKNLTSDFKQVYNHVSWRAIAGMRDITAHKYQTLKMGDVWVTLEKDIPLLKMQIKKILEESDKK